MKKVIWISSFLPRSCGIAYYSNHYITALKNYAKKENIDVSFKIIAHTDAKQADYPIISQGDKDWHHKVLSVIKKERPDLAHIQHEYGLYETHNDKNRRVIELINMIKEEGIPVIMTYHSIYKKLEKAFAEFVDKSLKELNAGIFHEQYQKDALKDNIGKIPKNVYVLPHGSREDINPKIDREEAREVFGYKEKDLIVGVAGIASENKGFRTLIRQWPKVVKKIPNAFLSLEIKPHAAEETKRYIEKVLDAIMKSPAGKRIEFTVKDYDEMEFYRKLKSFDILVLPYKSESQSGVLAHGFSVGAPAIVTDIEGLGAEIRNSQAGIAVKRREDFYKAIIHLLKNPRLRHKFSENALNYVKTVNGWNIIAKKTFQIYDRFW
ncbi:MAG: glycosyltransferase [Candidatus Nanoarchaeia archaeon]|nr:glycosyltransferase [Candidatus Nanoarchaeia archaeon]MDD5741049.1 glycosyltransferase [Candidatus Nanoarchaeia archaeon]